MDGAWIAAYAAISAAILSLIGTIVNVAVTVRCNRSLEMSRQRHQLSLAAIDKRLEVHQKAYALCAELCEVVEESQNEPEVSDAVYKCRYWWAENCLYLNKETRQKFVSVCCNFDPKSEDIVDVMGALEREMGFPSSSSAWRKAT